MPSMHGAHVENALDIWPVALNNDVTGEMISLVRNPHHY